MDKISVKIVHLAQYDTNKEKYQKSRFKHFSQVKNELAGWYYLPFQTLYCAADKLSQNYL